MVIFLKTLWKICRSLLFELPTGIITGILYSCGFPTVWGWHWGLSWIGLAILIAILRYRKTSTALIFSFGFGMGFFLSIYIWVTASVGWWVPWMALAILQSLLWLGWCICATLSRKISPFFWALLVAFCFSGFEQLRGKYPWGGSPWAYLAYTQVENHFSDFAPWLGESGISFLIVWIIAALIASIDTSEKGKYNNIPLIRYCSCILPAVIFLGIAFGGFIPKPHSALSVKFPVLKIAAVQGNIPEDFRAAYKQPFLLLNNHINETKKNNTSIVDLILWGEQSADIDPRYNQQAQELITALSKKTNKPLFYGSVTDTNGVLSNNYVLLGKDGQFKQDYQKKHLVPYGEYLPNRRFWERFIPQVNDLLPEDIQPGQKTGIFDLQQVGIPAKVGVNICFEEAISHLVRENVNRGAQLFLFPTNNASFSHWAESAQQLQISRFRAKEYQRATVQISINGVSGLIDENGNLIARSTLFETDFLVSELNLQSYLTFSARYGDYQEMTFLWGAVIIFITMPIICSLSYKKFKK